MSTAVSRAAVSRAAAARAVDTSHQSNNLDALRLVASIAVLVGHAWPLTGRDDAPRFAGVLLSHLAVYVFFSISGYLIATSWNSSPRVVGFLRRRVARIFPALLAVILLTIAVIGPLVTTLPLDRYFADSATWGYLRALLLAPSYELPWVFTDNPTKAVNGSLWTLGPEFICYLLVLAFGLVARAVPALRRTAAATALFAMMAVALATTFWLAPDHGVSESAGAMVFFAMGGIAAQLLRRGTTRRTLPLWPVIPLAVALGLAGLLGRDAGVSAAWIALPYIVLAIGMRATPGLRAAGRYGDISYGIYLWAFPIQQVVQLTMPGIPLVLDIALVLLATTVLAAASWLLIERRALAWARR